MTFNFEISFVRKNKNMYNPYFKNKPAASIETAGQFEYIKNELNQSLFSILIEVRKLRNYKLIN